MPANVSINERCWWSNNFSNSRSATRGSARIWSTLSESALADAMMPVLSPAGVQEMLDFGLIGFALSRYAGVWVGMKCVKDNFESTATVDGRPFTMRAAFVVGLEEGAAGQRLQPFRLDLGPRIYPKISQRALTVPAFA